MSSRCHLADGTLAQVSLQNTDPALLVRQRDVDELIQTSRPQDGRVNDVWSVCGTNDEDILLAGHTVHLSQDLVDDAVSCSSTISHVATSGLGYGVQLIKEQDTGSCLTSLQLTKCGFRKWSMSYTSQSVTKMFSPCQRSL